jgi:S-adenosylmethionine:tRNA ribosyltransferase-isomerase
MIGASVPIQRSPDARLLVVDDYGDVTHHARADFPNLVREGDTVVANDAATLPASLFGVHLPTGNPIELRLAARDSLSPERVTCFTAIVFGSGDFRTPTEHRPHPPVLHAGDALQLGPLRAVVLRVIKHQRLVDVRFQNPVGEIWEGLSRYGRPIQYAHLPEPIAIWDTWTRIASQPVAFESPSAGFILDWTVIRLLRSRGARFATVTHAAGISSTGDLELDQLLPFDEPYNIPPHTATLIAASRRRGGRVIAIGTTVVRALEHAADRDGTVRSGEGIATQRIGSLTALRVVDAIVSGIHERGTSHYELLRAFQDDDTLFRMDSEAEARGYKTHEFGDSAFILHSGRNARFRASLEANAEPRVTADLLLAQSAVARSSTGASR